MLRDLFVDFVSRGFFVVDFVSSRRGLLLCCRVAGAGLPVASCGAFPRRTGSRSHSFGLRTVFRQPPMPLVVWEASYCSESVHTEVLSKRVFSFIASTPNCSCRLKVMSPPGHAAPVRGGFRPPSFFAGPLAPVVRVPDQPAVVEAREHAASVVVVVRRVRPEREVARERDLVAKRRARPAHEPPAVAATA